MGITAPMVVVTDLDGTLLDHDTYEAGPAAAAVRELQDAGVAVVCCSAKTRSEQEVHRRALGITGPFVIENGAAVLDDRDTPVRVLGLDYDDVRRRLRGVADRLGVTLRGFGDMPVEEVARRTGLPQAAAVRARQRDHTEPFVLVDADLDENLAEPGSATHAADRLRRTEDALRAALADAELGLQRGARFWTASGMHDKGMAVAVVRELFTTDTGTRPLLYGLGDTYNDTAMLAAVDVPMVVQRPDGSWADLAVEGLNRLDGVGPAGWCLGAASILATRRAP